MNLASQIRRDFNRLLRGKNANSADVAVIWNAADFSAADPNLESSAPTPVLQSGTWPAMVHFVQPTTSALRQFSEVAVGDAILDFAFDAAIPDGLKGARFIITGNPKRWVQKPIGKDLAEAWDTIVGGQRIFKTFLVTEEAS